MARPIRNFDPTIFRVITIRTLEARLWLALTMNILKLIGGIIARYQEILGIEIYAYCILGNHLHLLIRAPRGNSDEFCENINREIARRINWKFRREGKLWSRRYDDQQVLSEEDLLEAFLYINTNPTRHGLIRDSREWPGLTSFKHALNETDRRFSFYHYSAGEGKEKVTSHFLKLSILPQFAGMSKEERRKLLAELLDRRMQAIADERKGKGEGFLGREKLINIAPGTLPINVSKTPRPQCYTKCAELRREFKKALRMRREYYSEASFRFRLGDLNAQFPQYSFKPPLHRASRLLPFTPLTPDYLKNAA